MSTIKHKTISTFSHLPQDFLLEIDILKSAEDYRKDVILNLKKFRELTLLSLVTVSLCTLLLLYSNEKTEDTIAISWGYVITGSMALFSLYKLLQNSYDYKTFKRDMIKEFSLSWKNLTPHINGFMESLMNKYDINSNMKSSYLNSLSPLEAYQIIQKSKKQIHKSIHVNSNRFTNPDTFLKQYQTLYSPPANGLCFDYCIAHILLNAIEEKSDLFQEITYYIDDQLGREKKLVDFSKKSTLLELLSNNYIRCLCQKNVRDKMSDPYYVDQLTGFSDRIDGTTIDHLTHYIEMDQDEKGPYPYTIDPGAITELLKQLNIYNLPIYANDKNRKLYIKTLINPTQDIPSSPLSFGLYLDNLHYSVINPNMIEVNL